MYGRLPSSAVVLSCDAFVAAGLAPPVFFKKIRQVRQGHPYRKRTLTFPLPAPYLASPSRQAQRIAFTSPVTRFARSAIASTTTYS